MELLCRFGVDVEELTFPCTDARMPMRGGAPRGVSASGVLRVGFSDDVSMVANTESRCAEQRRIRMDLHTLCKCRSGTRRERERETMLCALHESQDPHLDRRNTRPWIRNWTPSQQAFPCTTESFLHLIIRETDVVFCLL